MCNPRFFWGWSQKAVRPCCGKAPCLAMSHMLLLVGWPEELRAQIDPCLGVCFWGNPNRDMQARGEGYCPGSSSREAA